MFAANRVNDLDVEIANMQMAVADCARIGKSVQSAYLAPELDTVPLFRAVRDALVAHEERLKALVAIKNGEEVSVEGYVLLMMMERFKDNPVIRDYGRVVREGASPKLA